MSNFAEILKTAVITGLLKNRTQNWQSLYFLLDNLFEVILMLYYEIIVSQYDTNCMWPRAFFVGRRPGENSEV